MRISLFNKQLCFTPGPNHHSAVELLLKDLYLTDILVYCLLWWGKEILHCVIVVSYRLTINFVGLCPSKFPQYKGTYRIPAFSSFNFYIIFQLVKQLKIVKYCGKDIPVREDTMGHIYGHKMILLMLDILTNISIFPQELTHLVFLQYHGTGTMEATA